MTSEVAADLRTITRFIVDKRRRELLLAASLIPVAAAAEILMVSAIVPLLALLGGTRTDLPMRSALGFIGPGSSLAAAATLFVAAALLAALLRLAQSWSTLRLAAHVGHDLNMDIQHRLLHQPYLFHVNANSGSLLASLDKVDYLAIDLVQRGLQGIGAAVIALAIVAVLLIIDPLSAAAAVLLVATLYGAVLLSVRRLFRARMDLMGQAQGHRVQQIQENLGGIRDIIIDRSQAAHLSIFAATDEGFMRARAEASFLSTSPRFVVEGIGLGFIALLGLFVATRPGGLPAALPVLGALALGAQRLLPLTSVMYSAWISVSAAGPMVGDVASLLRLPVGNDGDAHAPIRFREQISFERVGFRYPGRTRPALRDISLTIPHGSRVAIVGKTGSGKSTLADLLMGLLEPTEGRIMVDGTLLAGTSLASWRRSISHVPQSIFLADASIARNIAFGAPGKEADLAAVRRAAEAAQLDEFVATLPDGYETKVGERGVQLSGGQRQRLALARAIYKQAPLLVLDEATSALDDATEAAVLGSLDKLHAEGCTIVIIAHRRSTVERCDLVFRLDEGELVDGL
ncbi:MAG TPA: ABC transporter ATP-binding protein [Sphingomicrobium sp.]|nr:ABC transporter ATP-binding protein [Sphingomicrobium sp.]